MPADTKIKHPTGRVITFAEDAHTYTDDSGIQYQSVSSVLAAFSPAFDSGKRAYAVAKRENKTVDQVLDEWRKAGQEACNYGTRVHEVAEWAIDNPELATQGRGLPHTALTLAESVTFPAACKEAAALRHYCEWRGIKIVTEQLLAAPELRIAGTCDIMLTEPSGTITLLDWKTNKDLNKSYGKLQGPVSHLTDSPLNKYFLQLNLYMLLLRAGGYYDPWDIPSMFGEIIHLRRDGRVEKYEVPDLSVEVQSMIEVLRTSKKAKAKKKKAND